MEGEGLGDSPSNSKPYQIYLGRFYSLAKSYVRNVCEPNQMRCNMKTRTRTQEASLTRNVGSRHPRYYRKENLSATHLHFQLFYSPTPPNSTRKLRRGCYESISLLVDHAHIPMVTLICKETGNVLGRLASADYNDYPATVIFIRVGTRSMIFGARRVW